MSWGRGVIGGIKGVGGNGIMGSGGWGSGVMGSRVMGSGAKGVGIWGSNRKGSWGSKGKGSGVIEIGVTGSKVTRRSPAHCGIRVSHRLSACSECCGEMEPLMGHGHTYGAQPHTYGSRPTLRGPSPPLMAPAPHLGVPAPHLWVTHRVLAMSTGMEAAVVTRPLIMLAQKWHRMSSRKYPGGRRGTPPN